jgi:alanine racemase
MTDALAYRRTVVIDSLIVKQNVAAIRAAHDDATLVLLESRRANARFLTEDSAERFGVRIETTVSGNRVGVTTLDLLGGHPAAECAIALESHVYGLRDVAAGEGVSYGATYVAPTARLVALAPIGFADGLDRKLSGSLRVRVDGVDVPVVGRIAMDSISIDVTNVPDVAIGSTVVAYGDTSLGGFGARDAALALAITPSEIIARLSERAEVVWR